MSRVTQQTSCLPPVDDNSHWGHWRQWLQQIFELFLQVVIQHKTSMLECSPFDSSPTSAPCNRPWIGSALVQLMACRLFGAKLLSKPMLVIVNWNLSTKPQWNLYAKRRPSCPGGDELTIYKYHNQCSCFNQLIQKWWKIPDIKLENSNRWYSNNESSFQVNGAILCDSCHEYQFKYIWYICCHISFTFLCVTQEFWSAARFIYVICMNSEVPRALYIYDECH